MKLSDYSLNYSARIARGEMGPGEPGPDPHRVVRICGDRPVEHDEPVYDAADRIGDGIVVIVAVYEDGAARLVDHAPDDFRVLATPVGLLSGIGWLTACDGLLKRAWAGSLVQLRASPTAAAASAMPKP